jgi:hypothetical protein
MNQLAIADMKAMYDRYLEQLNWYKMQLVKGINVEKHDEYSEQIKELSVVVFKVNRALNWAMDVAYEKYIINY